MASKRDFKKSINNLTFELISECYTYKYFHPEKSEAKVDTVIEKIVQDRNQLIAKTNNLPVKGKKEISKYFQELKSELKKLVNKMDGLPA